MKSDEFFGQTLHSDTDHADNLLKCEQALEAGSLPFFFVLSACF